MYVCVCFKSSSVHFKKFSLDKAYHPKVSGLMLLTIVHHQIYV